MHIEPTPGARARFRARVAAWSRAERGDTLIEVMIAAVLVALIATASLTGFGQAGNLAGNQRNEEQAATLAQQDQARLRGLTITQLTAPLVPSTWTIDGTIYTVTSNAHFISGPLGTSACTTGVGTSADEVQTTSTVTWGANNDGRPPVIVHGLITPTQGGAIIVAATDQTGSAGLAGVIATPTGVSPLTTDSNGCAVFGGLALGTYNVAFTAPGGAVTVNGVAPPSQSVTVTPTQSPTASVQLGVPGTITALFSTSYGSPSPTVHASTADWLVASNTQFGGVTRVFGADETNAGALPPVPFATTATVFPFTSAYTVYAGTCSSDLPPGGQYGSATVGPGATVATAPTLTLPAMIIDVYTGTSSSNGSLVKPSHLTVTDTACASVDTPPISGTLVKAQGALVDPGQPYSSAPFSVCADNGSRHFTATVSNNYPGPNTVNIYFGSTSSGVC
jgi:Tfp pilus assembly protein PilV